MKLQDLQIDQNNKLKITDNPNASVIDLAPYLDNTDNQTIHRNGYDLSITDGNTIDIRPDIIAFRAFIGAGSTGYNTGQIVKIEFVDSLHYWKGYTKRHIYSS